MYSQGSGLVCKYVFSTKLILIDSTLLSGVTYVQFRRYAFPCNRLASNPAATNNDIIVPHSVSITAIAFPSKVGSRNLRLNTAPRPLSRIRIRRSIAHSQSRYRYVVQPRRHTSVSTQMVLKARPSIRWQRLGRRDTLWGQIRQSSVVGFAVVHEDLGLSSDAEVFVCALSRVGHGDEGYVGVGQSFCGFAVGC